MKRHDCNVCNGPEIYGEMPTIIDSDLWRVEPNPNQQHLGRTFIGLREHKSSLSELSPDEFIEFRRVVIALEIGVRAAFQPDLLNWMCLMNDAVRDSQPTHVHWHMVPRYKRQVEFRGHTYTDDAWPRQYNTGKDTPYFPNPEEVLAITNVIRSGVNRSL